MVIDGMDGLQRLDKVFRDEFLKAKVQRSQVNVCSNVIAIVFRKQKMVVTTDIRPNFYSLS